MFLLDQNLRQTTTEYLRGLGYDAVSTRDLGLEYASDDEILAVASRQARIVVTYNGDFGDVRDRPFGTHAGIIRLRVHPQIDEVLHPILKRLLSFVSVESLAGALTLVDNYKIRIRRAGQATRHILLTSN
jgi:predicted nuclease of predicted toxin-antitoxin system